MKSDLLNIVVQQLEAKLDLAKESADQAHSVASHEQSKPENQYDTVALEAAYLAHGQSERALELQEELIQVSNLSLREFDEDDPVGLTAWLSTEDEQGNLASYFILPFAGGMKLEYKNFNIIVLTPHSPLGKKMMGAYLGDDIEFKGSFVQITELK